MRRIFYTAFILAISASLLFGCASRRTAVEFIPPVFPPPPDKARFIYDRTIRNTFDVKKLTAMDRLKQIATGTAGAGIGLTKPYGVAAYHGKVFVTDTVARHVLLFDYPKQDYKVIGGEEGPGALVKPIGISIDKAKKRVYVADNTARRVVSYDLEGNFIGAYGGQQILSRPTGVAISNDGNRVYVVDTGGVDTSAHHLYIFDAESGDMLKRIGTRGKEDGQFNLPLQAAVGPDDTVYVVDGGNFRVEAFTADGEFIKSFGAIGVRSGQFSRPKGIAIGPKGNIYVVDTGFGNFQIFNPQGQLLTFVGKKGNSGVPGEFLLPAGIAVDDDGRIYLADQFFRKIEVYRPTDLPPNEGFLPPAIKNH